jgi:AAA+ ATPase superfamily predicted ATPase
MFYHYNQTMSPTNDKFDYKQYVAFINREKEREYLRQHINKEPSEILFLHGPKSSGKTTLLYRFLEGIEKEQKLEVKFLNLREKLITNYKDFIRIFFGIDYSKTKEDIKEKREYDIFKFFKLSVEELKGMDAGQLDPFEIMKVNLVKLRKNEFPDGLLNTGHPFRQ